LSHTFLELQKNASEKQWRRVQCNVIIILHIRKQYSIDLNRNDTSLDPIYKNIWVWKFFFFCYKTLFDQWGHPKIGSSSETCSALTWFEIDPKNLAKIWAFLPAKQLYSCQRRSLDTYVNALLVILQRLKLNMIYQDY